MTPLINRYTPAWRLFNLKYKVKVPKVSAYTPEYLRSNALASTGDKGLDSLMSSSLIDTRHSAAGLAMLMDQGYAFGLFDLKDCIQIYSDVQNHLLDWKDQTNGLTHPADFPPIEELRAFEALAIEVYVIAKKLEPKPQVRSNILDNLINLNRGRNLVATNRWLADRSRDPSQNGLKPYESIVDSIEAYLAEYY